MAKIDPKGPAPTNYHDRLEWKARREGVPPRTTTYVYGTCYNIPTDYHERKKLFEEYRKK